MTTAMAIAQAIHFGRGVCTCYAAESNGGPCRVHTGIADALERAVACAEEVVAWTAAEYFSEQIDGLGLLEQVDMKKAILQRAGAGGLWLKEPRMVKLGATVKDQMTGFEGVVSGRVEYLVGCAQLLVQPYVDEKGAWVESRWLDEPRCKVQPGAPLTIELDPAAPALQRTGGDREAPRR